MGAEDSMDRPGYVPDGVPDGRCGYTTEYKGPFQPGNVTCWRETWDGHDECIWHAVVGDKPAKELSDARRDGAARLDGAVLRGVELADLVDFADCILLAADFTGANLYNADLADAFLRRADLADADLREADLADADLREADLADANLRGLDFTDADLQRADFTDADLQRADFIDTFLRGVDLTDASLSGADLTDADLKGVDLTHASLWVTDFTEADLRRADLTDAYLRGVDLTHASLSGADLTQAFLLSADLENASFGNADLTQANLRSGDLTNADLDDATLTRANLEDATLESADLDGTDLTDAKLHNCRLQDVYISEETEFGDRCGYERAADPYDILSWEVVGPLMEPVKLTRDDHHLYQGGRLATAWHRFRYWTGRHPDYKPDDEDIENLEKAISTYRTYQRLHRENSLPGDIPHYFYREKEMRRLKALAEGDRRDWATRVLQKWVMGYGEKPWRVVGTSVLTILGFGVLYSLAGGIHTTGGEGEHLAYDFLPTIPLSTPGWLEILLGNLYFSAVTFSTLGYGDVEPASGAVQFLASAQSIIGAGLMALLVAVLARRITR